MELFSFSYLFSVRGRTGGLFGVRFELRPDTPGPDALQRAFQPMQALLEGRLSEQGSETWEKVPCDDRYWDAFLLSRGRTYTEVAESLRMEPRFSLPCLRGRVSRGQRAHAPAPSP